MSLIIYMGRTSPGSAGGQLGSDASGYHTVILKGTAMLNQGNLSTDEVAAKIRSYMSAHNYPLTDCQVEWSDGWHGYTNFGLNLTLGISALPEHDAERVRQLLTAQLVSMTWESPVSSGSLFLNVALRVESDGGVVNAGVNPDQPKESQAWIEFWKALGFTVAPTIGTAVVVGGLGLLALKKLT